MNISEHATPVSWFRQLYTWSVGGRAVSEQEYALHIRRILVFDLFILAILDNLSQSI